MPRNRLPWIIKHYIPSWQKESWQIFEKTSGYVRPERVNKWPNSMTYMMMRMMMVMIMMKFYKATAEHTNTHSHATIHKKR
jgi:hypothetical protein